MSDGGYRDLGFEIWDDSSIWDRLSGIGLTTQIPNLELRITNYESPIPITHPSSPIPLP